MPQMVRVEWLNLNGTWEFAESDRADDARYLSDQSYPDKIVVPFCRESKLSGLERKGFVKNVWYRRTFQKPADWKSPRLLLHVGACDCRTRVWVNGQLVGEHTGGSAPMAFDITKQLRPDGNALVIHAFDDTRSGLQATGKQAHSENSEGCVYTRITGIWQTVWLEGVGSEYIRLVRIDPDFEHSSVVVTPEITSPAAGLTFTAVIHAGGKEVGRTVAEGRFGDVRIPLSEKRPWSIEDPFLYDLKLTLVRDGRTVDQVDSYFGLRQVTIRSGAILINGKPVFQRTVLDQGFYPEGIWTAPTDDALRNDIKLSQAAGFNGARLHQKVFEPRFLYWADKLGYLVWGEFPNWGLNYRNPAVDEPVLHEWAEIVRRDYNHPAIIGWCPFNETPAEAAGLQRAVVKLTRQLDSSRPVIESSGYHHSLPDPQVLDAHDYDQNPQTFRARWNRGSSPTGPVPARYQAVPLQAQTSQKLIPFFVSEYGGIGWNVKGGWGYGGVPQSLEAFYERFGGLTDALLDNRMMFGYCYTQLTDIEQEQNGIYSYDRKPKFDLARLHKIQSRKAAYEIDPPLGPARPPIAGPPIAWRVLVGARPDGELARPWRYTVERPADGWIEPGFGDGGWKIGRNGFGNKMPGATPWDTKDIWLRQEFACEDPAIARALLVIHYDNGTEVYLNGKLIWKGEGWNDQYDGFDVSAKVKQSLRKGKNTIAIHCHQDEGGQFIDAALLVGEK